MSLGKVDINTLSRSEQEKIAKFLTPKMTEYIVHKPYPKQAAYMLLDTKEAFYGGAAGGGKSDALLMCALQYVDVPGYSAIIFRKTFADLVKPGALIDRAQEWLSPWTVTKQVRWVDKEKKFVFPSGAILQFGYMETPQDRFNYQGGEYQFIGFDEVTHMHEIGYTYMFSRLRRLKTAMDIPLRVRAASNPPDDGDNAEWVYDRFVNPETKDPKRVFIPAGMDDNPHLDSESYIEALDELDPVTRARLRDGLWEIKRVGNMFKEEWFGYVDAAPAGRRTVRFWDCAATEVDPAKKRRGQKPDYTVGMKMSEKDGIYYIEDIIHVQQSAMNVEVLQKNTAKADGYSVRIREEEEGGSSGKYAIAKKKQEVFHGYPFEGVRNTGSKIERAMPFSAAVERGAVKIVKGCPNIKGFLDELVGFPAAAHDDYVDGASGAFNALGLLPRFSVPEEIEKGIEGSYWEEAEGIDIVSEYDTGGYWNRL